MLGVDELQVTGTLQGDASGDITVTLTSPNEGCALLASVDDTSVVTLASNCDLVIAQDPQSLSFLCPLPDCGQYEVVLITLDGTADDVNEILASWPGGKESELRNVEMTSWSCFKYCWDHFHQRDAEAFAACLARCK